MVTKCQGGYFFLPYPQPNWAENISFYFLLKADFFFFWSTFTQRAKIFWNSGFMPVFFSNSHILPWSCTCMMVTTEALWSPPSTNAIKHNWSTNTHFQPLCSTYTLSFGPLTAKPLVTTKGPASWNSCCIRSHFLFHLSVYSLLLDLMCCISNPENFRICFQQWLQYSKCFSMTGFSMLLISNISETRFFPLLFSFSYFHDIFTILISIIYSTMFKASYYK